MSKKRNLIAAFLIFASIFLSFPVQPYAKLIVKSSTTLPSGGHGFGIRLDVNDNIYLRTCPASSCPWESLSIAKFNSSLIFETSITYTNTNGIQDYAMRFDSFNNLYVVGHSSEGVQNNNAMILKYSPSLELISSTTFNGDMNGNDSARDIAIDKNNNIFLAGHINWLDSLWLAKYNSNLVLQASTTLKGNPQYTVAEDIKIDDNGDIWLAGSVGAKGWLGRYNKSFILQSSQTITEGLGISNGCEDNAYILAIDISTGNIWVSGYSQGPLCSNSWGWRGKYNTLFAFISSITFECCGNPISVDNLSHFWEIWGDSLIKYDSSPNIISSITIGGLKSMYVKSSTQCWVSAAIGEDMWIGIIEDVYPPLVPILSSISNIFSITWNWNIPPPTTIYYNDATSYYVINESSQPVSPVLSSSTLSWTEIDLSTNTVYMRAVVAANQFGVSTSAFITKYTLAAVPENLFVSEVFITSVTLSWSSNGNPSYTRYEILQSTDNFSIDISTPVSINSGLTALTSAIYNLMDATTYYFNVRAYNNEDVATEYSNIVSSITLPCPVPDNPVINNIYTKAISTKAINWSWEYAGTNPIEGFRLISSTGGYIANNLSPSTTFYIQKELLPNTSSRIQVEAYYLIKSSTSNFHTIYTLANPPVNSVIKEVYQSSAAINWQINGNSAETIYQIYSSTDKISFALTINTTGTNIIVTNLFENTTYSWKIRSVNGDGIASNYDITISTYIPYIPPEPSSNLIAISSEPNKVSLSWGASPTAQVTQYNIYTDSGSGIINYNQPISTVIAQTLSLYISGISSGTYYYAIRAQKYTCEEKNITVKASVEVMPGEPLPLWVQERISVPKTGQKIWGNRLNVFAELIRGDPSYIKEIRFQYRASTIGAWVNIPAVYSNNPDNKKPYYIHWDVSGLAKQEYQIRAQAVNINNQADPYAPGVFISVSNNNPNIMSNISGNAVIYTEKIYAGAINEIKVGALDQNHCLEITIPPGALTADTILNIINPPAIISQVPRWLLETGLFYEIYLESGQANLNQKAVLKTNYMDEDNNGLIDGTLARADRLSFMRYDQGNWLKEYPTEIDLNKKIITMGTMHLSIYGIFSLAAENLNNIRIYPNPYKPNDGKDDTGKPYNPYDSNSGIIFDNLTQAARIEIYTITGQLVWRKTTDDTSGKIQWDARNQSGKDVASGGYIVLIIDTASGQKKVKKIGIIR